MKDFDFFISHAHEDHEAVATPIAAGLTAKGYKVWIDAGQLVVGDRLLKSINDGLARARHGVVVLSPSFFEREWAQWELEGLMAIETVEHRKIVLPVWHRIDHAGVAAVAPILAARLATETRHGMDRVISDLIRAVEPAPLSIPNIPVATGGLLPEPFDLEADAEEAMETGRAAAARIVTKGETFTSQMKQLHGEIRDLTTAQARPSKSVIKATINKMAPLFDSYGIAIERDAGEFGDSVGKAMVLMTQRVLLDANVAARRQDYIRSLTNLEEGARASKAVFESMAGNAAVLDLRVSLAKHARNEFLRRLQLLIDAHNRQLDDFREAKRLLTTHPE